MLEKVLTDDYWNVDGDRELSDTWIGFTNFTLTSKKSQDGYSSSGARLTRKQTPAAMPCKTSLCRSSKETCRIVKKYWGTQNTLVLLKLTNL